MSAGPQWTLAEARRTLADAVTPLAPAPTALPYATNLVLDSPVVADVDQPPGDVSAMDGYAVRADDLSLGPLPVAAVIQAGTAPAPLPEKSAARIFTGALLPDGADTVVPQERAHVLNDERVDLTVLPRGKHVRKRAEIFARGDTVLSAGTTLTPGAIGLAAAAGGQTLSAIPRVRLGIISTGDELVSYGEKPAQGEIRDSNAPQLLSLAEEANVTVSISTHVGDDLDKSAQILMQAVSQSDVVVTAGGVSVGDFDLIPKAVERLGGQMLFHGVKMRPGKPILVARLGKTFFIGLPGNPVAVAVGWRMFVRPLIEALAGNRSAFSERPLFAELNERVENPSSRLLLRPVHIVVASGGFGADIRRWKGSHDISGAATANGLLVIEGETDTAKGATLPFYPLPWSFAWSPE